MTTRSPDRCPYCQGTSNHAPGFDCRTVDAQMETLRRAQAEHYTRGRELGDKIRGLKKQKWTHKCCRCWPALIGDNGYCSCCDWDHTKGERVRYSDPDYN